MVLARSRLGRKLALALVGSLVGLLVFEGGLRLVGVDYAPLEIPLVIWNPAHDQAMLEENSLNRFDASTMWSPRPGASVPWGEGEEVISPAGFRGDDPDLEATIRILTLGDSSTFGLGVTGEEVYSAVLERELRTRVAAELGADAGVDVVNGGVIGFTIVQGIERYRRVRETCMPDFVVIAFGAVNEHFFELMANDVEKLELIKSRDTRGVRTARWLRANSRIAHAAAYVADLPHGGREGRMRAFVEANDYGEGKTIDAIMASDYRRRVSPELFGELLATFQAEVEADGGELVVLHMVRRPTEEARIPQILDYDPVIEEFAATSGVAFVPARADFHRRFAEGTPETDLFLDLHHPTPAGHEYLAGFLADAIEARVIELCRER